MVFLRTSKATASRFSGGIVLKKQRRGRNVLLGVLKLLRQNHVPTVKKTLRRSSEPESTEPIKNLVGWNTVVFYSGIEPMKKKTSSVENGGNLDAKGASLRVMLSLGSAGCKEAVSVFFF